jgi:hypothetical protein
LDKDNDLSFGVREQMAYGHLLFFTGIKARQIPGHSNPAKFINEPFKNARPVLPRRQEFLFIVDARCLGGYRLGFWAFEVLPTLILILSLGVYDLVTRNDTWYTLMQRMIGVA